MDNSRPMESSLSIACPHCGHAEVDEFEVVEPDCLQAMHCAECGADFHLAVMECPSCGVECVFTWAHEPSAAVIDHLSCPACTRGYAHHEAPSLGTQLHA